MYVFIPTRDFNTCNFFSPVWSLLWDFLWCVVDDMFYNSGKVILYKHNIMYDKQSLPLFYMFYVRMHGTQARLSWHVYNVLYYKVNIYVTQLRWKVQVLTFRIKKSFILRVWYPVVKYFLWICYVCCVDHTLMCSTNRKGHNPCGALTLQECFPGIPNGVMFTRKQNDNKSNYIVF